MNAPDYLTISELKVSDQMVAIKQLRIGTLTGALKRRLKNVVFIILTAVMKSALVSANMVKTTIQLNINWTM